MSSIESSDGATEPASRRAGPRGTRHEQERQAPRMLRDRLRTIDPTAPRRDPELGPPGSWFG